jgi:drug/metabolite transporter (DMT)-like permease
MQAIWQRTGAESKGIVLTVVAVLLFSIMDALAKGLIERHDPVQVVWARYASQTLWAMLILSPRLVPIMRTDRLGLQVLRSALLFGATLFFFASLGQLQLAEATAIFEVAPLVITILSVLILKEIVGPRRWFGVLAGLFGALVIIRPGTDIFAPAALLPLAAATCFAGYSIATRFLGSDESPFTSLIYTTLLGTIVASIAVPFVWTTPDVRDAAVMATFGAIGMVGQFLLILALRHAPASLIAPFAYCSLAYNTLWGFLFFGEIPDRWTVLGGCIIVGAGLYVWHREMRLRAPHA